MRFTRERSAAAVLADGRVIVTGGSGTGDSEATSEIYDPINDVWMPAPSMGARRVHHSATVLPDGRVLVAGGSPHFSIGPGSGQASTEIFDPSRDQWQPAASLSQGRLDHAVAMLLDGRIIVIGGSDGENVRRSAELFDPVSGQWTRTGDTAVGRFGSAAARLLDGRILVAGGRAEDPAASGSAELFDPSLNSWRLTSPSQTAREWPTTVTLATGRVLLAGFGTTAVELYNPALDRWLSGPAMRQGHLFQTSTSLGTGKILVAGGPGAELYEPATCNECPTTLEVVVAAPPRLPSENGQYLPNPFDVTVQVTNTGTILANAVQTTLYLPQGLSLAEGSATELIGSLTVGASQSLTWKVRAAGQTHDVNLSLLAVVLGGNTQPQNATRNIVVSGGFSVSRIWPNRGGDRGSVQVRIEGGGFTSNAEVTLRGQASAHGTNVRASEDGRTLLATFDLIGQPIGTHDLQVSLPDGSTRILPSAFTVEPGRLPDVWVSILGRDAARRNQPQTFTVLYGNEGNVDAVGVPLWIAGIPAGASWEITSVIGAPPPKASEGRIRDWGEVPRHFEHGGEVMIPLFVPRIKPGSMGVITITVAAPDTYEMRAWADAPFFGSPLKSGVAQCLLALGEFGLDLLGAAVNFGCLATGMQFLEAVLTDALKENSTLSLLQLLTSGIDAIVECTVGSLPVGRVIDLVQVLMGGIDVVQACSSPPPVFNNGKGRVARQPVRTVGSRDPNDKRGDEGVREFRYISGKEPLRYQIFFENKPDASAPAQEVVIMDQLAVDLLDISAFQLGPIGFAKSLIDVPPGLASFAADVDLRPANNLVVRVNAAIDAATGTATWRFVSLDPVTLKPVDDPLAGFLPPNTTPPAGEGFVSFTISPRQTVPNGTNVVNQADIVFDTNEAISTPLWQNTIDNAAPESAVLKLAPVQLEDSFELAWSGRDNESGVLEYTIFVAEDGDPFVPWLSQTSATHATFKGIRGRSYAFFSAARDMVGNKELAPSSADAVTVIEADRMAPTTVATLAPSPNDSGWISSSAGVSVELVAVDGDGGSGVAEIVYQAQGAQLIPATVVMGRTATVRIIAEGETTVAFFARDFARNEESVRSIRVRLDNRAPAVTCKVSPDIIWPPSGELVRLLVSVNVSDGLSGKATFLLRSIAVNEATTPADIVGFDLGTPDTNGSVRAKRAGKGDGRRYVLRYEAFDLAGNSTFCETAATVPHEKAIH
jgi:hypothetical protein